MNPSHQPSPPRPELGDDLPIPFVTRKSPVLLLMRLAVVVLTTLAFYILLRVLLPVDQGGFDVDTFEVFLIFTVIQFVLGAYVLLRWVMETYEIHAEDIHHNRGILFRKEETYPYNNMQSITCTQSPLGRIYHYGEVRLYIPTLGRDLVFSEVPHPHHFIHTVRHILPYPDQHRFIIGGS